MSSKYPGNGDLPPHHNETLSEEDVIPAMKIMADHFATITS
ncbi:MAG: hypothetical protein R2804_08345 [Cyclobacteriaceae bacterium]